MSKSCNLTINRHKEIILQAGYPCTRRLKSPKGCSFSRKNILSKYTFPRTYQISIIHKRTNLIRSTDHVIYTCTPARTLQTHLVGHIRLVARVLLHGHFTCAWLRLYSCTEISPWPNCAYSPARTLHTHLVAIILLHIHFTLTWLCLYSCTDIHFTFTWLRFVLLHGHSFHMRLVALMLLHDHFKLTWLRLYSCTDISHSPGCICTPARTFHSDLIALILLPIHFHTHLVALILLHGHSFHIHLVAFVLLHGHFTLT